jgi:hypothetical protein
MPSLALNVSRLYKSWNGMESTGGTIFHSYALKMLRSWVVCDFEKEGTLGVLERGTSSLAGLL